MIYIFTYAYYYMLDGHLESILHPKGSTRYIFSGHSPTLSCHSFLVWVSRPHRHERVSRPKEHRG